MIQTNIMGKVVYQTNDPTIGAIVLTESDFFTKEINEDHPLASVKSLDAGVFIGDTNTPQWRIVHKFLPPALGPKAVRHYAPKMQKTIEAALGVLEEYDRRDEAFNVYQFMLRVSSEAVGEIVLGMNFNHLVSADAPLHEMILLISIALSLNKKVTSRGTWYASLPFGDPQKLRNTRQRVIALIDESIAAAAKNGTEDLELQDAALKAANMVGMC
jgi:cytochrome P450